MYRARHLFCLMTLGLIAPATALAYPISPKPLWPLTAEANLIVVAEVTAMEPLPYDEERWVSAIAHLLVLETLKGPQRTTVEVPFAKNMICPAPARYAEGETVVAFLARDQNEWRTVSLSYGTLYPQDDELEDMGAMVRAAVDIQKMALKSKELNRRKREWLVQAAALPGTRWHGLYELAPESDRIRSFYDRDFQPARLAVAKRHLALLADAFVEAPKIDHTMAMMLRVLGRYEDPRVDHAALGFLEGLFARDELLWWTSDLLFAVLARFGDTEPEARLEEIGAQPWDVTPGQLRRLWSEAKGQLGIPDVPPAQIELEEYRPVGGRTPS